MIIRTYRCETCGDVFEVQCNSNDPDPNCPYCEMEPMKWQPGMFAIGTVKGKAVDIAQNIIEEDYGMTNIKDGNREGDVAAMMPTPEQTAARDSRMQVEAEATRAIMSQVAGADKSREIFSGAAAGALQVGQNTVSGQSLIAAAKSGPGGVDAMAALHAQGKAGKLPMNMRVVARS